MLLAPQRSLVHSMPSWRTLRGFLTIGKRMSLIAIVILAILIQTKCNTCAIFGGSEKYPPFEAVAGLEWEVNCIVSSYSVAVTRRTMHGRDYLLVEVSNLSSLSKEDASQLIGRALRESAVV